MSEREDDWVEEPPRRKGLPRWVWITCGSGCLLTLIAAAVLGIVGYKAYQSGTDPSVQWPRVQALLPFDERPPHLELQFGLSFGMDQIHLLDTEAGLQAVLNASPQREVVTELMSAEPRSSFLADLGKPVDARFDEIELQGEPVRRMRFSSIVGQGQLGPGVRLDFGSRGEKFLVVELRAAGHEVGDEEIRSFFEPFDLWRER